MNSKMLDDIHHKIALFQTIINHAPAVIGAKDLDGRYLFVNKEYTRLFHINQENFIGKTDFEIFPHEIASAFREADQEVSSKGETVIVEEKAPVNGELRDYLSVKFPIHNDEGTLFATGLVATDITERKRDEEKLQYLVHHDPLTGLPNRRLLNLDFNHELKRAKRFNREMALFYLDINRFKSVNDEFGHEVGDTLLQFISEKMINLLRESEKIYRVGGDEFCILIPEFNNKEQLKGLAKRVVETISNIDHFGGMEIDISCSIGIAISSSSEATLSDLTSEADKAMYQAKESQDNNYYFAN